MKFNIFQTWGVNDSKSFAFDIRVKLIMFNHVSKYNRVYFIGNKLLIFLNIGKVIIVIIY